MRRAAGDRLLACQRGNSTDSAFCAGCGQRFIRSSSDALPKPLSYTPRHLAEKILRDRAALEGERRNVTVLFSDAMGFTPLSERVDAEEVYGLMQGCLARMMEAVHRYEGTITSFTGDGVMALFGAPIAHEDSARRAIAAALEMQRSLADYSDEVNRKHPIECRFRVGLTLILLFVRRSLVPDLPGYERTLADILTSGLEPTFPPSRRERGYR